MKILTKKDKYIYWYVGIMVVMPIINLSLPVYFWFKIVYIFMSLAFVFISGIVFVSTYRKTNNLKKKFLLAIYIYLLPVISYIAVFFGENTCIKDDYFCEGKFVTSFLSIYLIFGIILISKLIYDHKKNKNKT